MKLNRRERTNLPHPSNMPEAWFYVNEGSISVIINGSIGSMSCTIPKKYMLAALAAMRKRPKKKRTTANRKTETGTDHGG